MPSTILPVQQMFSGQVPFYRKMNEIAISFSVVYDKKRPLRPKDELSKTRGLTNEIWTLVETCWAHAPADRPTAGTVVGRLRNVQDSVRDQRPLDDPDVMTPPSPSLFGNAHPFSSLARISSHDTPDIERLKDVTAS